MIAILEAGFNGNRGERRRVGLTQVFARAVILNEDQGIARQPQ